MAGKGQVLLTGGIGALLWWAVARWSGVVEPWDAPAYWTVFYPAALLACAGLGWRLERPWWPAAGLIVAQLVPMVFAGTSMLGFGVAIAGVLALPAMLVATAARWLAVRVRERRGG